jgi:hypothetical protein
MDTVKAAKKGGGNVSESAVFQTSVDLFSGV